MVKQDETEKPIAELPNWLISHDLSEIVETSKLEILPKYNIIPENDLATTRRVKILELPITKEVEKDGKSLILSFLTISDNDVKYSLPFNSKALQRSFIGLAIKFSNATTKKDIDLSKVINKTVGIKREQFTAKGFTQSPLRFYDLDTK